MISEHSAHSTPQPFGIHTYIHTYIHICWFNFDALAQGNAYKPTNEPINYRGPDGDRTHDLQTEATPPAASCPARTLHATEIAPKNATPMTCPWLHWTTDKLSGMHMVSISTPVCVNFELRPGRQTDRLLKIGIQRPSGFESCIQQRKTTCLLSIRKSLASARASKLTTTNMYIARARCECQMAVGSGGLNAYWS